MKRVLSGILLIGGTLLVAGFMYFMAGALLAGTRWEIADHGAVFDIMSLVGVAGMVLVAIGSLPLAIMEFVKR